MDQVFFFYLSSTLVANTLAEFIITIAIIIMHDCWRVVVKIGMNDEKT